MRVLVVMMALLVPALLLSCAPGESPEQVPQPQEQQQPTQDPTQPGGADSQEPGGAPPSGEQIGYYE